MEMFGRRLGVRKDAATIMALLTNHDPHLPRDASRLLEVAHRISSVSVTKRAAGDIVQPLNWNLRRINPEIALAMYGIAYRQHRPSPGDVLDLHAASSITSITNFRHHIIYISIVYPGIHQSLTLVKGTYDTHQR